MQLKTKRVLLTGATGLIGRQTIAPLRARGFTVIAMTRRDVEIAEANGTIVADLLDPSSMRRAVESASATHLVHLAWHDGRFNRLTSVKNLDWAAASLNLVRAFADCGGKAAVVAGSCAEYGWDDTGRHAESDPLVPSTLYGAAKASTGNVLMNAADTLGISLAWPRIFFCYGPGEHTGRLVGDVIAGLSAGRQVACTDGEQARDFMHTADVGRAIALLTDREAVGAVNIGSGKAVPVRVIVETVAELMNRPDLIQLGGLPRSPDEPACIEAENSRLCAELQFEPKFDLSTGLADVVHAEHGIEPEVAGAAAR